MTFDPSALLNQAAKTDPASTAHQTRAKLENQRVGCGCTGVIGLFLFGAYYMVASWLGGSTPALLAALLAGGIGMAAIALRGFHLWSMAAYLSLLAIGAGALPLLYRVIDPAAAARALPPWLLEPTWPTVIAVVGVAALGFILTQMRQNLSTQENVYAFALQATDIQLQKRPDHLAHLQGQLTQILDHTRTWGESGIWLAKHPFVTASDDLQAPPKDYTGDAFLSLLVVQRLPTERTLEDVFGDSPYIAPPQTLQAGLPKSRAIGLGLLMVEYNNLRYAPLRQGLSGFTIPFADIKRYRVDHSAFELEVRRGDTTERLAFSCPYAWRLLALAAFAHVFEADWDDRERAAIWALAVRKGRENAAPPAMRDVPASEALLERIDAFRADVSDAGQEALERLIEHAERPELAHRHITRAVLDLWRAVLDRTPSGTLKPRIAALLDTLGVFPAEDDPDAPRDLLQDLEALMLLRDAAWPELVDHVAEWSPRHIAWLYEDDDKDDDKDDEDDWSDEDDDANISEDDQGRLEASHEALIDLLQHVKRHGDAKPDRARQVSVEAHRAFGGSLLLDALDHRAGLHEGRSPEDVQDDAQDDAPAEVAAAAPRALLAAPKDDA